MLSKNQIKFVSSLKLKKIREQENLFIAEGTKVVNELLESDFCVKEIYGIPAYFEKTEVRSQDAEYRIQNLEKGGKTGFIPKKIEISESELKKISSLSTPNQVLAIVEIPNYNLAKENLTNQLSIALDDLQDPGNLGTIIRVADWFGIKNIICSNNTVDVYNPKVVQATMGSISRVNVHYVDLIKFFEATTPSNQPIKVYGAFLNGDNIYTKKLSSNGIILFGNESKGISTNLIEYINEKISIPSFSISSSNGAESLNVAISAGIICSEFRRSHL